MKFKIDENLPLSLTAVFQSHGHDADNVMEERLLGEPDSTIWPAAIAAGRALVTADMDFSDIRQFIPGEHPGVILYRDGPQDRASILRRFEVVLDNHDANDWARCFVVISARKVRVRCPDDAHDDWK
ncbi:MAG: DUF5615 family PIN-like protein [Phycisphaeraceae bacterium]|nr:DUF5615 family PIN-like protein [Phycisphaeraceae bacterium]